MTDRYLNKFFFVKIWGETAPSPGLCRKVVITDYSQEPSRVSIRDNCGVRPVARRSVLAFFTILLWSVDSDALSLR
jgi:hypothetical protein